MSKLSLEEPLGDSFSDVDGDEVHHHRRNRAGSDASSLASLLDNDFGDDTPIARLQIDETVTSHLDPKRWPRWKKMFVAIAIAFYTCVCASRSFSNKADNWMLQCRLLFGLVNFHRLGAGFYGNIWHWARTCFDGAVPLRVCL